MKKILLALGIGLVGCGSEMTPPSKDMAPFSTGKAAPTPLSEPVTFGPIAPLPPELLVVADQDTPVALLEDIDNTPIAEENDEPIVSAQQVSFVQLGANEVQLELQDCVDYSHVSFAPGHLIVSSTTSYGKAICYLINSHLIPGLKGQELNLNDVIQVSGFDFVIVAKG